MLAIPGDGVTQQDESECRLSVRLPPEMKNFFDESGYIATVIGEQRSSARLRVRCEALIHSTYTPPFLMRLEKRARVLVKDLSRSGIGILLHQQMYPTERFWIELNHRRLHVTVVRCRKLGDACFEIGASIEAIEAL
ncbi:MAG: hypothetical protein ACTHK7_19070 [Aureliella sp.]